jgi:hypothetical protein
MNNTLRETVKKQLGIDKEAVENGKWIPLGGRTDLEILVRPATVHNKYYQKKLMSDRKYNENFQKIINDQEKAK